MSKENKRSRAIALKYEEGERAPKVIASGAGEIAKRILQLAKDNEVPVKRDDTLVELLAKLDLGCQIPEETYQAVAEILAFLYRTDLDWQKRKARQRGLPAPKTKVPDSPVTSKTPSSN